MLPGNPSAMVDSARLMSSEGVLSYSKSFLGVEPREAKKLKYKTMITQFVDICYSRLRVGDT